MKCVNLLGSQWLALKFHLFYIILRSCCSVQCRLMEPLSEKNYFHVFIYMVYMRVLIYILYTTYSIYTTTLYYYIYVRIVQFTFRFWSKWYSIWFINRMYKYNILIIDNIYISTIYVYIYSQVYRIWTKWYCIWFKIGKKIVTMIILHSIWKEMKIWFCESALKH